MDQVSVTAASGLQSRMEALDMVANNLANTTTGGFKLDREFYSLFTAAENEDDEASTKLPLIQKQWTDFSQGVLAPTGNPLDLALSGKGFFAVNGPKGPLYTRNGSFQLSPTGQLTTSAAAADTTVLQGKTENSNVAPAESAVRLVGLMRQFEMLQKAITITSDMNKQALTEVARVGG
jgi:flagellar basal body rod protein FlgG